MSFKIFSRSARALLTPVLQHPAVKLAGTKIAAAGVTALALASGSAAAVGNGPIVYASYDPGFALFQVNADGSGRTAIAGEGITDPTLSPDGTQIAYLGKSPTSAANRDLYVMRADGSARRLLASYPELDRFGGSLWSLAWSPDGTKLAYLLPVSSEPLRIVDVTSGAQVPVTPDRLGKSQLAWSPDGTEIAFIVSGSAGNFRDRRQDLATGAVRNLSPSPGAASPRWSPDGTQIAYVDHNGGEWVVARGGGNVRRIDIPVLTPEYPSAPVWSLDGRTIFFSKVVSFGPYVHGYPTDRYSLFAAKADGPDRRSSATASRRSAGHPRATPSSSHAPAPPRRPCTSSGRTDSASPS